MKSARIVLFIPFLVALAAGAFGVWLLSHGMARPAETDHRWLHWAVYEINRDGTLLLFAGILLVATILRLAAPDSQRRLRTSVFAFFLYIMTVLCGAVVVAGDEKSELYVWIHALAVVAEVVAVTSLSGIIIFDVVFGLVRIRVPPILREVVTAAAYVLMTLALLTRADVHISSILTTSAVLTAVIGLSIQSTLSDMVSGVFLEWEDTIEVGDWIKIGSDVNGRVKEIRWRHMTIETRNWETIVIPNSTIVKSNVVICGKRTGQPVQLRRWVYFNVSYRHAPNRVIEAVNEALQMAPIERVALEPRAHCILYDFHDWAGWYAVRYWLTDLAVDDPTDSVIRTRIYAALQRAGIEIATPSQAVQVKTEDEATLKRDTEQRLEERLAALKRSNLFAPLTQDECYALVPHLVHAPFAKGEVMTKQGADAHWLYMIKRGRASVHLRLEAGTEKVVATLSDGDYFGEMALLTGEKRTASVIAETDVDCWRLDREGFKSVIENRPEMAQELAKILASRKLSLEAAKAGQQTVSRADMERDLFHEITSFFGLAAS
ncbi:MAG TPA: mechanosensitive ion channel family protein [Planctomycetota bacterium]|nr:mechanosensitive ion channel family protein [Planctomycetota bacterium]